MDSVIGVADLSFSYPGAVKKALTNIQLQVTPGEFIGITGPAGAGKTTLVLCLNGIIPHFQAGRFEGQVFIGGLDSFEAGCGPISKLVGSVFQDPEAQLVAATVEDEIAFGLENFAVPPAEMETRITEALELVGVSHLRQRSTQELSGGQKQRVAIAAAVALRPQILLLDEPTSELDPAGTLEVLEVLKLLNQKYHLTVIVVEQKLNVLLEYINRLVIMDQGRIICDRPPREVLDSPELLRQIGLNLPPVSELAHRLKQIGFYSAQLPLTVDEAYWGLRKSFTKQGETG